jgi:hypothetical protein
MNYANVTRLLKYLEQLKDEGDGDKFVMSQYLSHKGDPESVLRPNDVTNWECGTAGCLAGSWTILNVKAGMPPPISLTQLIEDFVSDFGLTDELLDGYVTNGGWSPKGCLATLDEAIDYLRLCLAEGSMEVELEGAGIFEEELLARAD